MVVFLTALDSKHTLILTEPELDIDYILQTVDTGCVEGNVSISDHNRRITQVSKQFLADNHKFIAAEGFFNFLPAQFLRRGKLFICNLFPRSIHLLRHDSPLLP